MKNRLLTLLIAPALTIALAQQTAAQGTAFTYQGRLDQHGAPYTGNLELVFTLWDAPTNGTQLASTTPPSTLVAATNGLFVSVIDFGATFTGADRWLQIAVRTNTEPFTTLWPRQQLTPTPYAMFAAGASNLLGSLPATQLTGAVANSQLANNSLTIYAGRGLGGGGPVALGGATTMTNAGVVAVLGNDDITAGTTNGVVTLGDTATSANVFNTIVKRDAAGNFAAGSLALNGTLNLPPTTATAGMIKSGGTTLLHAYGALNFFAGPAAGNLALTGVGATGTGVAALYHDTSGSHDTANGSFALFSNTTGSDNTADGFQSLRSNTSGFRNVALGFESMAANTTGNENLATGYQALAANTEGHYNVALGYKALQAATTSENTAVGYGAMANSATGSNNVALGYLSLTANTTGNENTALGYEAMYANTAGSNNVAVGDHALASNAGSGDNVAVGYQALVAATRGQNVAVGSRALASVTSSSNNVAIGYAALSANTSGVENTALGYDALAANVTGSTNVAVGYKSMQFLDGADSNTGLGAYTLQNINNGHENVGVGYGSLNAATSANQNVAVGYLALANNLTGSYSVAIGYKALQLGSGNESTAVGYGALSGDTTASNNAALGYLALAANTAGSFNTAMGYETLYANTTGSNNIALGYQAGINITEGSSNIDIGNPGVLGDAAVTRIGSSQRQAFVAGVFGATVANGVPVYASPSGQLGTLPSSRRFKEHIRPMRDASEAIYGLQPVTFHYKRSLDPIGIPQFGLIAEQVAKEAPDLVERDSRGRIYAVRYQAVNTMLLNEIIKLHRHIDQQDAKISSLMARLAKVENVVQRLEAPVTNVAIPVTASDK